MPRKAALRAAGTADEPNVVIPLASSYNERGIAGFTHTVTNSEDQRKVNVFYELVKNAMTGKGTLTLSKRLGVTIDAGTYGVAGQVPYLVLDTLSGDSGLPPNPVRVVFNTTGAGLNINTGTLGIGNILLLASASIYLPQYAEVTSISNVFNAVLQIKRIDDDTTKQRVFFITIPNLLAGNAWTEIVDADFTTYTTRGKMEFIDGFAFILTSTNLIINSDTNSLANWTASNFLAKQIQQDRAVGLARVGNILLAFGDNTVEAFFNNGNTTGSPLGRLAHFFQKIGLVPTLQLGSTAANAGGTHYYATIGKRIFFVGRMSGGGATVGCYTFDGQIFEKVSTSYIDKILSEKYALLRSVNAVGFQGQNAVAICWTTALDATQQWLMFFPEWREWFEWNSTIFSPVNSTGFHMGIVQPQKLFNFTASDNWQDNAVSYAWSTQFKLPTSGSARKFMPMYGVDADTDTSANSLTVEISIDDSKTFSTLGTIDQAQDRKVLFRGGSFRRAHVRLGNTNARPSRLHNFLARIE